MGPHPPPNNTKTYKHTKHITIYCSYPGPVGLPLNRPTVLYNSRWDAQRQGIQALKGHLRTLDHAALRRGVMAARRALEYRLDGWSGEDMLPLLLYQMHQRLASFDGAMPAHVKQLYNDVSTSRDYNAGLDGDQNSMAAHLVESHAGLEVTQGGVTQRWQCSTFDGANCPCMRWTAGLEAELLRVVTAAGSDLWRHQRSSGAGLQNRSAAKARWRPLMRMATVRAGGLKWGTDYRSVLRHVLYLVESARSPNASVSLEPSVLALALPLGDVLLRNHWPLGEGAN